MRILVIGGTRNLGPSIIEHLQRQGHAITVFNRGLTPADLAASVERLYGDRRNKDEMARALGSRDFDAVIDTTLYTGAEALAIIDVLRQRTAHYIFISTGQVYLIRRGIGRPFKEDDYEGELIPPPPRERQMDYENWLYGFDKREAEDHLFRAWNEFGFPVTSLRAPMIHGIRDHYGRILGYVRRLEDGGPILIPDGQALPVRHVYSEDIAKAIASLVHSGAGKGRAFNLSQDETVSIEHFLAMVAGFLGADLRIVKLPRNELEQAGLLPSCSPFSGRWMSELDNTSSKAELGITYTGLPDYLETIVNYYKAYRLLQPEGYSTRPLELEIMAGRRPAAAG